MSTDPADDLEIELRRLECDKRVEEIRQLKVRGRAQWITPAALAAIVPLLAGLGIWVVGKIKQYNEGYRALQEVDRLAAEKDALQEQKNNLNIEVSTLLDLKRHYAEQANELQAKFEERQQQLDATYARARFAAAEAGLCSGAHRGAGTRAPRRSPGCVAATNGEFAARDSGSPRPDPRALWPCRRDDRHFGEDPRRVRGHARARPRLRLGG